MPKDKSLKPDIDEDLEIGQRLNWKVICVSSSFSLSKSLTFRIFLSSSPLALEGEVGREEDGAASRFTTSPKDRPPLVESIVTSRRLPSSLVPPGHLHSRPGRKQEGRREESEQWVQMIQPLLQSFLLYPCLLFQEHFQGMGEEERKKIDSSADSRALYRRRMVSSSSFRPPSLSSSLQA